MNIQEIINEADNLVPNNVDSSQKIVWLNAINQDFFNVVKIPVTKSMDAIKNQSTYVIDDNIREKNIFNVRVGHFFYRSINYTTDFINDTGYMLDDDIHTLTLLPAPYTNGQLLIGYFKIGKTTYTTNDTTKSPDAPTEYHWTYIPALAAYLAKTEDDAIKASNYETEYKSAWNVAAQNYQVGEPM